MNANEEKQNEYRELFQIQRNTIRARQNELYQGNLRLPAELFSELSNLNVDSIIFDDVNELKQRVLLDQQGQGLYFNAQVVPYFTGNIAYCPHGELISRSLRDEVFGCQDVRMDAVNNVTHQHETDWSIIKAHAHTIVTFDRFDKPTVETMRPKSWFKNIVVIFDGTPKKMAFFPLEEPPYSEYFFYASDFSPDVQHQMEAAAETHAKNDSS